MTFVCLRKSVFVPDLLAAVMIGLEDRFSQACCSLTPERLTALRGAGVLEAAFQDPLMVGMAPIQTHKGGLFDPVDDGDLAVLLPVGEWDGLNWRLEDIVAFHLDRPERWWCRRGSAEVLGVVDGFFVEPRRLHATPLNWLIDEGQGICILNWRRDPLDLLLSAGPIEADQPIQTKLRTLAVKATAARVKDMFQYG